MHLYEPAAPGKRPKINIRKSLLDSAELMKISAFRGHHSQRKAFLCKEIKSSPM